MTEQLQSIWYNFILNVKGNFNPIVDLLDILVVTFLIYEAISLVRQTRTAQLAKGIIAVLLAYAVANLLGMRTLAWLINSIMSFGIIALVVVFQPELRRALDAGRFGRLVNGTARILWNRTMPYYEQAPWRGTWAQDGGTLMNQCIHGVDLLRWMMGDDVVEVYAQTAQQFHHYLECEDVGMAVVKFANGAIGTIEGTTNVYPKNLEETLYLFGETGTVKIGGTSTNNIDVWQFADQREEDAALQGLQEATSNVYGNGHTAVYADMMDAIVHDRAPYIDAQAGRRALEMILAMYQSAATGMPVKLPLKDVASLDFTGRFDKKEETNG